jgi:hypothetical protein
MLICLGYASAQQNGTVRIEKHTLVSSSLGPVRSIAFSYDFPDREHVAIPGLGTVAGRGTFRYLTREDKLQFLESGTGRTLLVVPLENPEIVMGRYSVALPALTDFPSAFRSGRWEHEVPFPAHASEVLNRQFPSGYMVLQVDGANSLITTYRTLDSVREPLYGRVAVMVQLSAEATRGAGFRVRLTGQERRSHTDWQEIGSQEVQKAAEQYISSLVRELEGSAP